MYLPRLFLLLSHLYSVHCVLTLSESPDAASIWAPMHRKEPRLTRRPEYAEQRVLGKRQASDLTEQPFVKQVTQYFAAVFIGDPDQPFNLQVDTKSSDIWVYSATRDCKPGAGPCDPAAKLCTSTTGPCQPYGAYDSLSSITHKVVNHDLNIPCLDGTNVTGDYVSDTFRIWNTPLSNQVFGRAHEWTGQLPKLGLGYVPDDAVFRSFYEYGGPSQHPSFAKSLQNRGFIKSNSYSIYLNNLGTGEASLLFGAVDADRYADELRTFPIIPTRGRYSEFVISLTSIGINGEPGSVADNFETPVLLDYTETLTYLPDKIVDWLGKRFKVEFSRENTRKYGGGVVDCDLADQAGSVDFGFFGVNIAVPLHELVLVVDYDYEADADHGYDNHPICVFGIAHAGNKRSILGDTFLRSAYVVYDLNQHEISLAQTTFGGENPKILEIVEDEYGGPVAR